MVEKRTIDMEALAALIEDSLSACVGRNVVCPQIHLRQDPSARENWYIELDDVLMIQAIRPLQQRFNVKRPRWNGLHSPAGPGATTSGGPTASAPDVIPGAAWCCIGTTTDSAADDLGEKLFGECHSTIQVARRRWLQWSEANRSYRNTYKNTLKELQKLRLLVEEFPAVK